jgi:hypothetical protein
MRANTLSHRRETRASPGPFSRLEGTGLQANRNKEIPAIGIRYLNMVLKRNEGCLSGKVIKKATSC